MIRVLLIDDEAPALRVMRELLQAHPDIDVVADAKDVASALAALTAHAPDLVFLDIRLRGETGFDFLAAAPDPLPRVIFVTAYDKFAVRAFECNAMDYLLKPVEPERLAQSLERVRQGIAPAASSMTGTDSVFIKNGQLARLVSWGEISSIRADGNYTCVTLSEGAKIYMQRTLKEWASQAPENFLLQIHRSTLVQKAAILGVETTGPKQRKLLLKNGEALEISRNFWPSVKSAIEV